MNKQDLRKELDRVFKFIVKNKSTTMNWPNNKIKKFLRWAWYYQRLFILRNGNEIAAIGIAWRTDHPENEPKDVSLANTEIGNYLCVYQVMVHPKYSKKGLLFQLMALFEARFPNTTRTFWTDRAGRLRIIETKRLIRELYKWASLAATTDQTSNQ
jgi:GNAT superfamily N-acetyltransferase